MTPDRLIPLGSGFAAGRGIGNKAALLDRAARAGLPVPRGVVLPDEECRWALEKGLLSPEGEVSDPTRLVAALDLPRFSRPVAVRSAFSAEDTAGESLAGAFDSRLSVDPGNPGELAEALAGVWQSAGRYEGGLRRDVLILEMVEAQPAGVAFTEREFEDDLVNFVYGPAEKMVSGETEGTSLSLPKLRHWEEPGAGNPPFAARLQELLRDVRREFGAGDWDVEWADDGERCWLLQVRPVVRGTVRNEAFTVANHKEILPELPSRFMTSLIASCADGLFAYYRRFDRSLPERRPFIEVFLGRPFINLSLMLEMMRTFGLPTRLVTDSIGGGTDRPTGLVPGRFFRKAPVLFRLGVAQLQAVRSARHAQERMLKLTENPGGSIGECVETLRRVYTVLVTEMFSLTAAMSGPLALLRQLGTLAEHGARGHTVSTGIYTDLEPLRELAEGNPDIRTPLEDGAFPDAPGFRELWSTYIQKHGHRGIYESDISRPRFHEQPETLFAMILEPGRSSGKPSRTLLGRVTLPFWWQAGRGMRAREELRYHAMIGFDRIRQTLLTLAAETLPDPDLLWLLDTEEARKLDTGWRPGERFFGARRQEVEDLRDYDLPDVFRRFDDLEQYRTASPGNQPSGRLRGVGLTRGEARGRAWVLREPSTELPDDFSPGNTILVARSVDAGWVPTFSRVAGVVVETGGDLSHGSIILREMGLPAITNASRATSAFETGDELILQADTGTVARYPE
ncbi:MAG: PEP-utilizing enzyme [Rubrobacteraceae bacterium]